MGEFAEGQLSDWNAVDQPRNALQQLHVANRVRAIRVSDGTAKERQDCSYGIEEDDLGSGAGPRGLGIIGPPSMMLEGSKRHVPETSPFYRWKHSVEVR